MLTPGKVNDARMMDKIPVEAGAFYLMDRGYVAFEKLYKHFQQKGALLCYTRQGQYVLCGY